MLLLCASVAVASDRFASPSGSGANPCTQAAPCDIVTAINGASANDDVTIGRRVRLDWMDRAGVPLPVFRLDGAA